MFHPIGDLPPSVYWRRRLTVLASVVVLIAITIYVLKPGGKDEPIRATAADRQTTQAAPTTTPAAPTTSQQAPTSTSTSTTSASRGAQQNSSSAAPKTCNLADLSVKSVVAEPGTFKVGDNPVLMLQVTNTGSKPCVQDLADSQVELTVYNGESRVWGSHDCQTEPGTSLSTLPAGRSVRVSITWSGLSSDPGCTSTRQRVGAGSYTLYAKLAGKQGAGAPFSIS